MKAGEASKAKTVLYETVSASGKGLVAKNRNPS